MRDYQKYARAFLKNYLDNLFKLEEKELVLLSKKWGLVANNLEDMITKLSEKEIKSLDQLYKLDLWKQFLSESKYQSDIYNKFATKVIADNQLLYAKSGLDVSQQMIEHFTYSYGRMSIDTVRNWVGQSAQGSPIYDILKNNYGDSAEKISNILLNATAIGQNPRVSATLMTKASNEIHWKSLRVARTEQLNIFRNTSLMQYKESGVVDAWQRIEQSDAPDEECQNANGQIYQLDEPFDSHPNCRGASIPVINIAVI
jgi:SPP1 gp7 family putative phage head morphogenesis protein